MCGGVGGEDLFSKMIFFSSVCRVFFADCVYICVRQCWEDGCFQILCFSDCQRHDFWLLCVGARDDVGTRSDLNFFSHCLSRLFFSRVLFTPFSGAFVCAYDEVWRRSVL